MENIIYSIFCSFFAYWLSYVDHPCLLAPETFDIRFARIPIRQDCKKAQHVLDSWEVWHVKKWERKTHLKVKCTFWLEHNYRKYELSKWLYVNEENVSKLEWEECRWDLLVCMRWWTLNNKKTKNILGWICLAEWNNNTFLCYPPQNSSEIWWVFGKS